MTAVSAAQCLHTQISDSNFQSELNIIKQIAVNNGYQPSLIDHLLNKKFYSHALKLVYPPSTQIKRFHTLTYVHRFCF